MPDRVLDRLHEADGNGWSLDDGWRLRADGTRFRGSALIAPLRDGSHRMKEAAGCRRRHADGHADCLVIRDITDKRESARPCAAPPPATT